MKFKKLEWNTYCGEESTVLFGEGVGGFATVIVFKQDDEWHLHYETKDPSEHILSGPSKRYVKDMAQEFHNRNVEKEFFVDEKS